MIVRLRIKRSGFTAVSPALSRQTGWGKYAPTVDAGQEGQAVQVSVTHAMERQESQFIQAVSGGWPI
jgi:hypothetical protein